MRKFVTLLAVLFVGLGVSAQNRPVTGTVTDSDGHPVVGAVVSQRGTSNAAITTADGRYSISVPADATLVFSVLGMTTQEVEVESRSVIDVVMLAAAESIDEVVVVAYGTIRKSSLTGSVATVKASDIAKVNVTSFEKALQGLSPGVIVSSATGQPGASTTVRIRGVGSFSASAPLYVIDGIVVETANLSEVADDSGTGTTNPLSSINPNDIESVSILKDASAAALYGSRAANGVIVVTTKKGKTGAATVNFRMQTGFSRMSANGYETMSAEEHYRHYFNGQMALPTIAGDVDAANAAVQKIYGRNPYNVGSPFDANGNLVDGAQLMIDTDWMKEIFSTGKTQEYDLSVAGGSDKTQYFFSLGYFDQEGLSIGSTFDRWTGRTNINSRVNNWFAAGVNATFSRSIQDTPTDNASGASPLMHAVGMPNTMSPYDLDADFQKQYDEAGKVMYNFNNPLFPDMNVLYLNENDFYNTKTHRFLVAPFVELTPLRGLSWKTTLSYDYTNMDEKYWMNRFHGSAAGNNGRFTRYAINQAVETLSSTLNYDLTVAEDHTFNAMAGYEVMDRTYGRTYAQTTNFAPGGLIELGMGSIASQPTSKTDKETMISYLGRLRYDYKDKIYAEGSIRTDGSSRFAPGHRWGTFWSVSAGWRITQESFMEGTRGWLDDLKLRASYGLSGNNKATGLYSWMGVYGAGTLYNQQSAAYQSSLANPTLGWEIANNTNIGLDFSLFRSRLSGTVEYYVRKSDRLLLSKPLATSTGMTSITTNMGGMKNSGIEVDLHSVNVQAGGFVWRTDFNIAWSKNVITKIDEVQSGSFLWKVGNSLYEWNIQEWAGVNPEDGAPLWYKNTYADDGVTITGRETTSTYSQASRYQMGSSLPTVHGGMSNTLSWKGIDLSFALGYSFGGKIYDSYEIDLSHDGKSSGRQMLRAALDSWSPDNTDAKYPKFVPGNSSNSNSASSRFLHDADFIKLRTVNLAYNLPGRWAQAVKMSNIRLFASAENLMVWNLDKDFLGWDIEMGGINGSISGRGAIPIPRTFLFGLNLTF